MTTTLGIFLSYPKAEEALRHLKNNSIVDDDISYIYLNEDSGKIENKTEDTHKNEKVSEGGVTGATTGAVVGGLAGLAVANGILPGLGTLFVAGPLAAALGLTGVVATTVAGAATGAAVGGLIGALTQLGIDKDDVAKYESYIRKGNILIIVKNAPEVAKRIFLEQGAIEVKEY